MSANSTNVGQVSQNAPAELPTAVVAHHRPQRAISRRARLIACAFVASAAAYFVYTHQPDYEQVLRVECARRCETKYPNRTVCECWIEGRRVISAVRDE